MSATWFGGYEVPCAASARGPEMRPELRPGVEAEHGKHHAIQRGRDKDRPHPVAVRDHLATGPPAGDQLQGHAERAGQVAQACPPP